MAGRDRLVVVGNGMAGARTVEEILQRGGDRLFEVTMFGDEPYGNYNRILLSGVLAGVDDAADIFLNPLAWYRDNGITLHAGVRVTEIDRWAKKVFADDGTAVPYDKLIIATGSRPFFPPFEGLRSPDGSTKAGVFGFRTIDDCNEMTSYAAGHRRVAVIGGGLLGLEAARGMLNHGLEVHVIHQSAHLMNQQLDAKGGAVLKATVENLGLHVHLGKSTTAVLGDDRVTGLAFADGTSLDCDMVIVATGVRPNSELAARGGFTVERAIVVDDQMRTVDDPDVYAVGECAQHRDRVYGLVAPLWEQAKVLADHITHTDSSAAYRGSRTATKLKVMGVELAVMGVKAPERDEDEFLQFYESKRGVYKTIVVRDGKLVGATLLGDVNKVSFLIQAFDRATPLPPERLSLLFDLGTPSVDVGIGELAGNAQVCNCNGVSKGSLVECVAAGNRTVKSVMETTRAGMGCGACRELVAQIVDWACEGSVEEDPSANYYVPGVPLTKPALIEAVRERGLKSVSAVFEALAGGVEDPGSKMGLASLLKMLWGAEYEDERDARFINDRVHANIQKDGTFSVVPRIAGGVTTSEQLRTIADVADRYQVPLIKLTGGQRIDLLGIRKEDLPRVWRDLGMPSGYAYGKTFRTCKTCVGSDFCRFGLGDSTSLGIAIEERFKGIESPGKLKLAVAGCPRNCSEAMVKDVGAVAVEGGRWEIYVGGAAGSHIRKGDVLCVVDTHDEVMTYVGRFMQYYRENAKWLERTYSFVERIGMNTIRAVVVDDSEGIAERLDSAMQASVDAYADPWLEASDPATATQFASSIKVGQ
ncbi:MAG: nitrite reductase large subunit [Actinomycetota bacterium]|nr:nitrite reductase large subunit [Actinomycetota bacterium]